MTPITATSTTEHKHKHKPEPSERPQRPQAQNPENPAAENSGWNYNEQKQEQDQEKDRLISYNHDTNFAPSGCSTSSDKRLPSVISTSEEVDDLDGDGDGDSDPDQDEGEDVNVNVNGGGNGKTVKVKKNSGSASGKKNDEDGNRELELQSQPQIQTQIQTQTQSKTPSQSQDDDADADGDVEKEKTPLLMYQYIQKLGDRQKRALEKFYHTAVEAPCKFLDTTTNKCEDADLRYFNCTFFHQHARQYEYEEYDDMDEVMDMNNMVMDNGAMPDPFDRNIIGPKSCEYCHAPSTLECDPNTCERPPLYFLKKRPPFEGYRG